MAARLWALRTCRLWHSPRGDGLRRGRDVEAERQVRRRHQHGKLLIYRGPCPPPGVLHHYVFTLFATDLEPKALKEGLTRDELVKALEGHAMAATGLFGTFVGPARGK